MKTRRDRLESARLYLVCDEQTDEFLHAALHGGVDLVQLRMKHAAEDLILAAARRFRRVCDEHGALLIVNDQPDLAVAADADGVHLGQDDVPVGEARRVVGTERLVGLSTHNETQIDAACTLAIDYIGVGPVNQTPTKPGRPPVGLDLVRYAATHATIPFFAIGGISGSNIGSVLEAGAGRVAVVRALAEADDPEAVARELRVALSRSGKAEVGAA